MTIDKQKLLQWIEETIEVYSGPFEKNDTELEIKVWEGKAQILNKLKQYVEAGEFKQENEEEVKG